MREFVMLRKTSTNKTSLGTFMAQPANALSNYTFVAYGCLSHYTCKIGKAQGAASMSSKAQWMLPTGHLLICHHHSTVRKQRVSSKKSFAHTKHTIFLPFMDSSIVNLSVLLGITSFSPCLANKVVADPRRGSNLLGLIVMAAANLSKFGVFHRESYRWWCNMALNSLMHCMPSLFIYKKRMNSTTMLVILVLTNVFLLLYTG